MPTMDPIVRVRDRGIDTSFRSLDHGDRVMGVGEAISGLEMHSGLLTLFVWYR